MGQYLVGPYLLGIGWVGTVVTNRNVNKVPGWTIPIPMPSYTLTLQIISGSQSVAFFAWSVKSILTGYKGKG